jgi:CheY-like chemotaxis protein
MPEPRELRILIVDDEPQIRATVSAMLQTEGYAVDEAANGADALHAVEHRAPDVILLDMRMPVLDGWGFARELRRRGHRTPIVVMTAARDAARWAREIAAETFVAKPFGFDDLLTAVEEAHSPA